MAWVKVDDQVPHHPKFLKAGPEASWLWLCSVTYSQRQLTDGIIPREAVPTLGVKNPRKLIDRLVGARLWDLHELGWRVHDYLDHNESREQAIARREQLAASRAQSGRGGAKARWQTQNGKPIATPEKQTDGNVRVANECPPSPSPSPAPSPAQEEKHTQGTRASAPIHSTVHRKHAHCGIVCVPADLHDSFRRARNHDNADKELHEWYLAVDDEWSVGARKGHNTGGNDYRFWRDRFDERWPAERATPAAAIEHPRSKTVGNAAALRAFVGGGGKS
jgi:hypothetical protein